MLLHSIFSFLRPHPRLREINEYSSSMEVHGQRGAEDQLGDFPHGVRSHSRKAIVRGQEAGGRGGGSCSLQLSGCSFPPASSSSLGCWGMLLAPGQSGRSCPLYPLEAGHGCRRMLSDGMGWRRFPHGAFSAFSRLRHLLPTPSPTP